MADLTITAASVVAGTNAITEDGIAAVAVTAGQAVCRDDTTRQYKLADANAATADVRTPRGIALNGAAAGQPLTIIKAGDLTLGATIAAGVAYYLSATPGGICPVADLVSGDYPAVLGIGKSTTVLAVDIQAPGAALA